MEIQSFFFFCVKRALEFRCRKIWIVIEYPPTFEGDDDEDDDDEIVLKVLCSHHGCTDVNRLNMMEQKVKQWIAYMKAGGSIIT